MRQKIKKVDGFLSNSEPGEKILRIQEGAPTFVLYDFIM